MLIDGLALLFEKRGSGVAVDAALSEARVEIAYEVAFDKVERDEGVFYQ